MSFHCDGCGRFTYGGTGGLCPTCQDKLEAKRGMQVVLAICFVLVIAALVYRFGFLLVELVTR